MVRAPSRQRDACIDQLRYEKKRRKKRDLIWLFCICLRIVTAYRFTKGRHTHTNLDLALILLRKSVREQQQTGRKSYMRCYLIHGFCMCITSQLRESVLQPAGGADLTHVCGAPSTKRGMSERERASAQGDRTDKRGRGQQHQQFHQLPPGG